MNRIILGLLLVAATKSFGGSTNQIIGYAWAKTNLVVSLANERKLKKPVIGNEYRRIDTTDSGCLLLCSTTDGEPTLGFLPRRDRLGSRTADFRDRSGNLAAEGAGELVYVRSDLIDFQSGFVSFRSGQSYGVASKDDTSLLLFVEMFGQTLRVLAPSDGFNYLSVDEYSKAVTNQIAGLCREADRLIRDFTADNPDQVTHMFLGYSDRYVAETFAERQNLATEYENRWVAKAKEKGYERRHGLWYTPDEVKKDDEAQKQAEEARRQRTEYEAAQKAKGLIQDWNGKWITPQEKQKREAEAGARWEIEREEARARIPSLEVVGEVTSASGEFGNRVLRGTVRNNTGRDYKYVQIEINLYDRSGAQVGSTMANVLNLESHTTWRFEAPVLEDSAIGFKVKSVTGY